MKAFTPKQLIEGTKQTGIHRNTRDECRIGDAYTPERMLGSCYYTTNPDGSTKAVFAALKDGSYLRCQWPIPHTNV